MKAFQAFRINGMPPFLGTLIKHTTYAIQSGKMNAGIYWNVSSLFSVSLQNVFDLTHKMQRTQQLVEIFVFLYDLERNCHHMQD